MGRKTERKVGRNVSVHCTVVKIGTEIERWIKILKRKKKKKNLKAEKKNHLPQGYPPAGSMFLLPL